MDNTINIDVSIIYLWYDHLILRDNGDAQAVTKAINDGDFDTFMKFYKKYPPYKVNTDEFGLCEICYFPDTAAIFYKDELIGSIDITNPLGFSLITFSEYECG